MVPTPMLHVQSGAEAELYDALREQLPDPYVCYHGVTWLWLKNRPREGEADFLIAHPNHGVLVLEVKGGQLTYDPSRRMWRREGQRELVQDPFDQAQRCMHWLVDEMSGYPGLAGKLPSYGFGVAFPNGEYKEQAHPNAPLDLVVDRRDMDGLQDRIGNLFAYWHKGSARPFGQVGMDAVDEILGYRVQVLTPLGTRIDEAERRRVGLTPEQAYVFDMLRRLTRAGVGGAAGSGKTLLAIEIARHHAHAGRRTLLTCLNKRLGQYLRDATADEPKITATHFHELAYEIGVATGTLDDSGPWRADDDYYKVELPRALSQAADLLSDRFEAMVIDEGQDLQQAYWEALLLMHDAPEAGPLYVFADDNQNIYRGAGMPLREEEFLPPLRTNMRNSREIQEFLAAVYQEREADRELEISGESFGPVQIVAYSTPEEAAAAVDASVRELIDRDKVSPDDVALLSPWKEGVRACEELGGLRLSDVVEPRTLLSSSLQGFKGLERPVVVLAEVGERDGYHLVEHLYVGGSRALMKLVVVAKEPFAAQLRQLPGTG